MEEPENSYEISEEYVLSGRRQWKRNIRDTLIIAGALAGLYLSIKIITYEVKRAVISAQEEGISLTNKLLVK